MKYYIKDVFYGITGGPLNEVVIATIEYEQDSKTLYFSIVDVGGLFSYYLSETNIFNNLIDEEYAGVVEESEITEFNNIDLSEVVDNFDSNNDDYVFLIYALLVLRLDDDETKTLINNTKNKALNFDDICKYDFEDVI